MRADTGEDQTPGLDARGWFWRFLGRRFVFLRDASHRAGSSFAARHSFSFHNSGRKFLPSGSIRPVAEPPDFVIQSGETVKARSRKGGASKSGKPDRLTIGRSLD